jgi:hypothetical protein
MNPPDLQNDTSRFRTDSAPKEHWATFGWYLTSNIKDLKIRDFSLI